MLHRHQQGNGILANCIARGSINLDKDGRIFPFHPILNVSSSVRSRPTRIFRSSLISPLNERVIFIPLKNPVRFIIAYHVYTCFFSFLSFFSLLFPNDLEDRRWWFTRDLLLSCFPEVGRDNRQESYAKPILPSWSRTRTVGCVPAFVFGTTRKWNSKPVGCRC